ncbi:MAG: hypothetical protein V4440_06365, partial [Pseudomonadota bacterium]
MSDNRIQVINAEGIPGTVPLEDLYQALANDGCTLVDPEQRVPIWTKDGVSGTIPAADLVSSVNSGDFSDAPIEEEPQGDRWGALIGKSLLSGALSFADLPVALAGLAELGYDVAKGNEIASPKS